HDSTKPAAVFSLCYAVNTLGGVAGAALTGFVLLRYSGLQHTLWIAAGVNILVAVAAGGLSLGCADSKPRALNAPVHESSPKIQRVPLACAALTGAVCTGLEVVWSRILGILTSNSAYGFSLLLTVLLIGLTIGGLIQAVLARRPGSAWRRLAVCQWLLAAVTLAASPYFHATPEWLVRMSTHPPPFPLLGGLPLLTAAAPPPPAILLGLSLPLHAS